MLIAGIQEQLGVLGRLNQRAGGVEVALVDEERICRGLDPESDEARSIALVRENSRREQAGVASDERVAEAIDLVELAARPRRRWSLENVHEGELHFAMDQGEGKPSRWNTLRALRVLRWHRGWLGEPDRE